MNIPVTCENYAPSSHYIDLMLAQAKLDAEKSKSDAEKEADVQARIFNAQMHQGAF